MNEVKFTRLAPGESRRDERNPLRIRPPKEAPGPRRHLSQAAKDALVEEILAGGHGTAIEIADREGLNVNLLSRWKADYQKRHGDDHQGTADDID